MSIYVVRRGDMQEVESYLYSGDCYAESFRIICS
jgi:hypothetical protein